MTNSKAPMTKAGPARVLIHAFIALHLFIIIIWGLPGSNFRSTLALMVEPYVVHFGLWHSWDMFSPDPLAIIFNADAQITFADGSVRTWEFPRMEKLGLGERYRKERFRKWRERVRQDAFSAVWDDAARYVARANHNPANPPVKVSLIRRWSPIPPPEPQEFGQLKLRDYQPIPKEYEMKFNFRFKTYDVQPGDL